MTIINYITNSRFIIKISQFLFLFSNEFIGKNDNRDFSTKFWQFWDKNRILRRKKSYFSKLFYASNTTFGKYFHEKMDFLFVEGFDFKPFLLYLCSRNLSWNFSSEFTWKFMNSWQPLHTLSIRVSQNNTFSYFQKAQFGLRFYWNSKAWNSEHAYEICFWKYWKLKRKKNTLLLDGFPIFSGF